MGDFTNKMGLATWDQPLDRYDYTQLSNNWQIIDFHDHSPGRGVQIPRAGVGVGAIGLSQLGADLVAVLPVLGLWQPLTSLRSGMITSGYIASARLEGSFTVRLKGQLLNSTGTTAAAGTMLAQLPSASMYPSVTLMLPSILTGGTGTFAALTISTTGAISLLSASLPVSTGVSLDGITFMVS